MRLLVNTCHKLLSNSFSNNVKRIFPSTYPVRLGSSYEGDGKTTLTILNKELDKALYIDSYGNTGFRLSNKVTIIGPLVIFHRSVLSWNISGPEYITKESLALFKILVPKIDILVIGLGDTQDVRAFSNKVKKFGFEMGINCEMLTTEFACSTYNFLISEGRSVAGCLIPPKTLQFSAADVSRSNETYKYPYNEAGDVLT